MIEMAQAVYLLFDPAIIEDTVHAGLFKGDNVHRIPCRRFSDSLTEALFAMGVTQTLVDQAANDALTEHSCYRALRVRRRYRPYFGPRFQEIPESPAGFF